MKIPSTRIEVELKKLPGSFKALLLYGPDLGLGIERANQVIFQCFGGKVDTFRLSEFNIAKSEDHSKILQEVNNISFFGGIKVIKIIGFATNLPGIIKDLFEANLANNFIVMIAEDLAASSGLRKFAEAHADILAIPCYKDDEKGVEALAKATFDRLGVKYTSEVPAIIAASISGDRGLIKSELEKIAIFSGKQVADLASVSKILVGSKEFEFGTLVIDYFNKNSKGFLNQLDLALSELTAVGVIRIFIKHAFKLLELKEVMLKAKISAREAVSTAKPIIFFKHQPDYIKQLERWDKESLTNMLDKLYGLEQYSKTSEFCTIKLRKELITEIATPKVG
ncbi:DNA polymerase III subunit delta [Rickettsiales endosymbiont of Stachyamoeba lipophora]|uniref:DNA polymerase III subunit delta n=1 Tax=Rickettsiales endosymbiont of Stachyamoeba lipophora TaxID=2486578 RepID=UPI000F64C047|nr:hypothetical protein [Rickettsiales endosymbiont of Stachyamoeba lipophora]AZL16061.1 hypothetical protein EF513_05875 [Rickettsiales endosymbiont of Stachyamoeba lipophora]